MIAANNVTLRIGKKALFEDVNIKFTDGNGSATNFMSLNNDSIECVIEYLTKIKQQRL